MRRLRGASFQRLSSRRYVPAWRVSRIAFSSREYGSAFRPQVLLDGPLFSVVLDRVPAGCHREYERCHAQEQLEAANPRNGSEPRTCNECRRGCHWVLHYALCHRYSATSTAKPMTTWGACART